MLLSTKKAIDAMERGRKTSLRADPRNKYLVPGTRFYLAIPFSLGAPGATFFIGAIEFKLDHHKKTATPKQPLPLSWLLDLPEVQPDADTEPGAEEFEFA